MSHLDPPTADADPVAEQLVAYLDGELSPAEQRAVEERLARDPEYSRQLLTLQRTWDALDLLPRADVDESFTRTTVEMVALRAADDVQDAAAAAGRRRALAWGAVAAGALLALGIGYAVVGDWVSRPNDKLLRDLPVIEKVDHYRHVESLEFLRQLERSGLFDEEVADAS